MAFPISGAPSGRTPPQPRIRKYRKERDRIKEAGRAGPGRATAAGSWDGRVPAPGGMDGWGSLHDPPVDPKPRNNEHPRPQPPQLLPPSLSLCLSFFFFFFFFFFSPSAASRLFSSAHLLPPAGPRRSTDLLHLRNIQNANKKTKIKTNRKEKESEVAPRSRDALPSAVSSSSSSSSFSLSPPYLAPSKHQHPVPSASPRILPAPTFPPPYIYILFVLLIIKKKQFSESVRIADEAS